jgi:hypothetical protein
MFFVEVTSKNCVTGKSSVVRLKKRYKLRANAELAAARMNMVVRPDGKTTTCETWGKVIPIK